MKPFNRTIFKLTLEDDKVRISVRLRHQNECLYAVTNRRTITEGTTRCPGWRQCYWCETIQPKGKMFLSKNMYFCDADCAHDYWKDYWDGYTERMAGAKLCSIIKKHDEDLASDPNKLDIKNFLRKAVDCV